MSSFALAGLLAVCLVSPQAPDGFLVEPKDKKGPGVLVLHPWWGLNMDVKGYCKQLALAGFVAYAPDLFGGKTATTPADAEALVKAVSSKPAELRAKIDKAARFLEKKTGKKEIGVVGFSFGAYYALEYSNVSPDRVRSVVVYYGTGHEEFGKSKASYLGHFAEKDDFEPKAVVDRLAMLLKNAGRPVTIYTYPETGHWFIEPSVKAAYNKNAASLAWERTVQFLKKNATAR